MEQRKINCNRDLASFEDQLEVIRTAGFNPIGVAQMMMEDTFIFETQEEALKAYRTLERDENEKWIGRVAGWWHGKADFLEAKAQYEDEYKDSEVLTIWL